MHYRISTPASSSNLGCGVDCLGLALPLRFELSLRFGPSLPPEITGPCLLDAEGLPLCITEHLIFSSMLAGLHLLDSLVPEKAKGLPPQAQRVFPPFLLQVLEELPRGRGLGSSAAEILLGVKVLDLLFSLKLSDTELLKLAHAIEGHPDNLLPSFYGGMTVAMETEAGLSCQAFPFPASLKLLLRLPEAQLKTSKARDVLPASVPLPTAIQQGQRLASFLAALLSEDRPQLQASLEDQLFMPARAPLYPDFLPAKAAALKAGAKGFFLSGAGPSSIAFVLEEDAARVQAALEACPAKAPVRHLLLAVEPRGLACHPITN